MWKIVTDTITGGNTSFEGVGASACLALICEMQLVFSCYKGTKGRMTMKKFSFIA